MSRALFFRTQPTTILFSIFLLGVISLFFFSTITFNVSIDARVIVKSAIHGQYDDWRSPYLAYVWMILYRWFHSWEGVFFTQILLVTSCSFIVTRSILATFLTLLFPPIFTSIGLIEKDYWSASLLILSYVAVYKMPLHSSKPWICFVFLVAQLPVWFRLDSAPLLIPFYVMLIRKVWVIKDSIKNHFFRLLLAGIFVAVSCVATISLRDQIFHPKKRFILGQGFLWDLTAISLETRELLFPSDALNYFQVNLQTLKKFHTPSQLDTMFWHSGRPFFDYRQWITEERYTNLVNYWQSTIYRYPKLFFIHRKNVMKHLLEMDFHPFAPASLNFNASLEKNIQVINKSLARWQWLIIGFISWLLLVLFRYVGPSRQQEKLMSSVTILSLCYLASLLQLLLFSIILPAYWPRYLALLFLLSALSCSILIVFITQYLNQRGQHFLKKFIANRYSHLSKKIAL